MKRRFPLLLFLVLFVAGASHAENAYVSDDLNISIRTGKTLQHRILRFVRSGTPVTVLETDDEGYSLIRIPDGTEGWTESRNLMDGPHARVRLEQVERRLEQLTEERATMRADLQQLQRDKAEETERANALAGLVEALEQELAEVRVLAARPLELTQENEALQAAVERERILVNRLSAENAELKDQAQRDWFLTGGGVAIGSLLLGIILTRIPLRRRRQTGWID